MNARRIAFALSIAVVFYFVIMGRQGLWLISQGGPVYVAFGLGVLGLPLVGAWVIISELRFGLATQRLARELEAEGGLPPAEVPTTPGGRLDRDAADAVFSRRKAEVEADPENWRPWYRLAVAYGDARDTARGRKAMRRAIALHAQAGRRSGHDAPH